MKIKELVVNQICTIPLVATGVTARETKARKPYLAMDFYDGTDTISGNYWDWSGKAMPPKNAILDVTAQVTEWQGAKQLNIKSITSNTTLHISEFTPSSGQDIGELYKDAYAMLSEVCDDDLRTLALAILEAAQDKWLTVPAAKGIHHAYAAGTLIHSLSVAKIAGAIASQLQGVSVDLCVVGGMLHDLGKLYTYEVDGITIGLTDEGKLYEHSFIGAEFIGNFAGGLFGEAVSRNTEMKIEMLRHIILSHHGKLEYGATVPPMSAEAHIVSHADNMDAAIEQIKDQSSKVNEEKWTERIWPLDNKPHLTFQYVQRVMTPRE